MVPPQTSEPRQPVLHFWPAIKRNPVLNLLCGQAAENGYVLNPVPADGLASCNMTAGDILHVHWVHQIIAKTRTAFGARRKAIHFIGYLEQLQRSGVKLVWTVHNRLSHDARHPEVEIGLQRKLSEIVDAIHIMNPDTVALTAPLFPMDPDKIFECPHPSYAGSYPCLVSRSEARASFDVAEGAVLLVTFGAVQRRKGIHRLARLIGPVAHATSRDVRLIIAGQCNNRRFRDELESLIALEQRIVWRQEFLTDNTLADLILASDAVVCPYREGLNSGVAIAGASFGRPIVIPDFLKPIFHDHVAVAAFQPDDDQSLMRALIHVLEMDAEDPARRAWADAHDPTAISTLFFKRMATKLAEHDAITQQGA